MDVEISEKYKNRVYLICEEHVELKSLLEMNSFHILKNIRNVKLLIPYDQRTVVSYFNNHAHVLSRVNEKWRYETRSGM